MGRSFGPELLNFKYTNKLSYRFWTKSPVNEIGKTFAGKRNMRRYLDTLFIMSEFLKRQASQLYRGCKTRGGRAFIPCFCQHAFAKAKQRNSYRNIWSRYESTISQ